MTDTAYTLLAILDLAALLAALGYLAVRLEQECALQRQNARKAQARRREDRAGLTRGQLRRATAQAMTADRRRRG